MVRIVEEAVVAHPAGHHDAGLGRPRAQARLNHALADMGDSVADQGVEHLADLDRVDQRRTIGLAIVGNHQGRAHGGGFLRPTSLDLVDDVLQAARLQEDGQRRALGPVQVGGDIQQAKGGADGLDDRLDVRHGAAREALALQPFGRRKGVCDRGADFLADPFDRRRPANTVASDV